MAELDRVVRARSSMPRHLVSYLRTQAPPLLVGLVWLGMLACALGHVSRYASPIPQFDDCSVVSVLAAGTELSPRWLWSFHNEHRMPIPNLVIVALLRWTHDFRSLMYAGVYLLAAISLGLILVARRIRGRTTATDAFFPLLFLHPGHYHNLLIGFQIALVIQAVLSATVLILVAGGSTFPSRRTAIGIGACLVALTLSGAAGLLEAPVIAVWLGLAGLFGWKSKDPARRRSAPVLLAVSAASWIVTGLYFVGYRTPPWHRDRPSVLETLSMTRRVVAASLGFPDTVHGWVTGTLLAGIFVATLVMSLAAARARPAERWRVLGIVACACATLVMACGIAWGRGNTPGGSLSAERYVTLVAPLPAALYLAWTRYGSAAADPVVRTLFCIGMAAAALGFLGPAQRYGAGRLRATDRLIQDVEAGYLPKQLANRHWRELGPSEEKYAKALRDLRTLGFPPYARPGVGDEPAADLARVFSTWDPMPIEARSDQPLSLRYVGGVPGVLVHAPGEIVLEIPPDVERLSGRFRIHPLAHQKEGKKTAGVRFRVEYRRDRVDAEVLFERVLDPANDTRDAGVHAFAVDLPAGTGSIVLRVEPRSGAQGRMDWGLWSDVEFD